FSRIVAYSESTVVDVVGPYKFKVWTKSGLLMEYGSRYWVMTAGWQQSSRNYSGLARSNSAKVWVLDRLSDAAGNFMEIDYADRAYEAFEYGTPGYEDYANTVRRSSIDSTACANSTNAPSSGPSLPTPIGAFPKVEYWPTTIRYYAAGSAGNRCGTSLYN